MSSFLFPNIKIAIRGGGDLASGVAYRLHKAGFPALITELAHPLLVRRAVSYGSAVVEDTITVDGITARRAETIDAALEVQDEGDIPVIIDPEGQSLPGYTPVVLIDARMLKQDVSQSIKPPLTVGLGPGFTAGRNCDIVIETNRGHYLGRVIHDGGPEPNTGVPGRISGQSTDRVLRAPVDGIVRGLESIGVKVADGQPLAEVAGQIVSAPFAGVLRGLVHDGLSVKAGAKIGDVDPRSKPDHCFTISDKSLAIGGGVLEAILSSAVIRQQIRSTR